ncbi:EamA family transporter [Mucilaginibacter gynuensis]|uniref:DMT family transporter n=1 Tax=Mucilaginibacter gynuensis TaxID=1302236 RepID=UPI0031E6CA0C
MKKAYIKLHIALLLAGFTGIFGRLITLNEGLLSWYRLLISAIGMFLFLVVIGRMSAVNNKGKLHIAGAGALLGFHWLFFYGSIKYTNISVGVVCFAPTSFFNAVMAPLINKKKFSAAELLLSSLTLFGISLIFGLDAGYRNGIILGIISSTFGALYTIYNERLVQKFTSEMIILYQMFGGLAALTLVMPLFLTISPAKSLLPSITDLVGCWCSPCYVHCYCIF